MQDKIKEALRAVERDKDIHVLYACESGSRAWGFPSTDSDYDVRFIYTHPSHRYLSIDSVEGAIDLPIDDELDLSGWDIQKTLQLFRKSNAALYEWLQSPIVYYNEMNFLQQLRQLMSRFFNAKASIHHYVGITKNTLGDINTDSVKIKKYFYALRSTLAAHYVAKEHTVPPMEFQELLDYVNDSTLNGHVATLMEIKTQATEDTRHARIAYIDQFITDTIQSAAAEVPADVACIGETETLNNLFRNTLAQL